MKIKILYAEDDTFAQEFKVKTLKECGFNVCLAEDGQKAWEEYQKGRYDVLLLDGNMPEMTGEEVMRLVRATGDDIAIVMYSNLPDYTLLRVLMNVLIKGIVIRKNWNGVSRRHLDVLKKERNGSV